MLPLKVHYLNNKNGHYGQRPHLYFNQTASLERFGFEIVASSSPTAFQPVYSIGFTVQDGWTLAPSVI